LESKEEMNNLIKDLMKLDLSKFTKPRYSSTSRRGEDKSPRTNQQQPSSSNHSKLFSGRHNSAGDIYKQEGQEGGPVPTIQLMINTNYNNFCITPVSNHSANTSKNYGKKESEATPMASGNIF